MSDIKFLLFFVALAAALCVRPAHASGIVSGTVVGDCNETAHATHTWRYGLTSSECEAYIGSTLPGKQMRTNAGGTLSTGGQDTYSYSVDGSTWYGAGSDTYTGLSCPSGSTGTTSCTCTDPNVPSADGTACEIPPPPACPDTGTVYSSGYYDMGTVDAGVSPPITTCDGGCSTTYTDGTNAQFREIINGVYHYAALGSYVYDSSIDAGVCSGGPVSPGSQGSSLPADTCAIGQSLVTGANGYQKCFNDSTGEVVDSSSAEAIAAAAASVAAALAAQAAAAASAASQAASDAVIAAGGTAAEAAAAGSAAGAAAAGAAAGAAAAGAASSGSGSGGTSSGSGSSSNPYEPVKTDCDLHPDRLGCLSLDAAPAIDTLPETTPAFTASTVFFQTAAGCPAPVSFNVHIRDF